MPEIGEIRKSEELGYKTPNKTRHIWLPCPDCGKERWVQIKRGIEPIARRCRVCANTGSNNPSWKGGRVKRDDGYILILLHPNDFFFPMAKHHAQSADYVMEHRLVMAKHLGRCLQPWELVHHKGIRYTGIENRSDNLIDNLELITNGQHSRDHSKGYRDGYRKGYKDAKKKFNQS